MARKPNEVGAQPVDAVVGDDGAVDGIAQRVTLDDIQAAAYSTAPLDQRRSRLAELRNDLGTRGNADRGEEYDALMSEIDRLLAELDVSTSETATRDAIGMTPADRADTMAPDELVETYGEAGGVDEAPETSPSVTNDRKVRP